MSTVSKELTEEIGNGVTAVMDDVEKARAGDKPDSAEDIPTGEVQPGETAGGKAPDEGKKPEEKPEEKHEAKPEPIKDALIERAVKAGMTISDARAFGSPEALERITVALESRDGGAKGDKKPEAEAAKKDEELDPVADIPDLDPDDYDEKVVAGFKAMKDLIRKQHQVISGMRSDGANRDGSWFEGQVAALGDGFTEALGAGGDRSKLDPASPQAAKRAELETKFKILEAGYKAADQKIDRETVFKEAVSLVLGDVAAKVSSDAKAKALEQRKTQHVARPSGGRQAPATNVLADVAAQIDAKFGGKK